VIVLDAYAVLAFLRDEAGADEVAALIRHGPTGLTAANLAEVVDRLVRAGGRSPDDVYADLGLLGHAGLEILTVTLDLGLTAGRLRAGRCHREHPAVSLADCVAAAAALSLRAPLATADPVLAELVRAEGGEIHPLPDSQGVKP
jgi:PIN domain nuclease of toxin-antitoxin system